MLHPTRYRPAADDHIKACVIGSSQRLPQPCHVSLIVRQAQQPLALHSSALASPLIQHTVSDGPPMLQTLCAPPPSLCSLAEASAQAC